MTLDELYAYYVAARKYLGDRYSEQSIYNVNTLAEAFFGKPKAPAETVMEEMTFSEFSLAMGVGA